MLVREATRADALAIYAVHVAAFGGDAEARLVGALAAEGDALVSLVCSIEGSTVGHIMFSTMVVEADGCDVAGAGLAPLGVLPAFQKAGIGSRLIGDGLARLPALGIRIAFVLGHAGYYPRFGFDADLAAPFASPYAGPHFTALMLDSALAKPQRGRAYYAPAFARLG
jgi:putative acetyltransferase